MRGGAEDTMNDTKQRYGQSPHARGSHKISARGVFTDWSIPACAGEPMRACSQKWRTMVNPRMRGGARYPTGHSRPCSGQSPHARGSLKNLIRRYGLPGSIPAYAGEPGLRPATKRPDGVNPRIRGGAAHFGADGVAEVGQSPHTRGSHFSAQNNAMRIRSIPAYAGEPLAHGPRAVYTAVNPRIRGGTTRGTRRPSPDRGQSPHTRGNRAA